MSVKNNYSSLNIAVVGCGNWGKNLIRVISELGALHSICDIDPHKMRQFSDKYGVPGKTLDEIAHDPAIDAVMIATPSGTHYDSAHRMLMNNKHVFIEKPFTLKVNEAVLLHQLAVSQNKALMVGHLLQYHPVFQTLKKLKQDNVLGNILYICSHRSNFGNFQTEQNVVWDYAPHDISMILSLVGQMPFSVHASGSKHLPHTQTDVSTICLTFPHDIQAYVFCSWIHPFKEQKLTVVGDKAMAIFDDCQPWQTKLKLCDRLNPQEAEYVAIAQAEPLSKECMHFLDSILNGTTPLTNGMEGINVTTVFESAIHSLSHQQSILVTEVTPLTLPSHTTETLSFESHLEETYMS